jgi:hypothetical protein
LAALALAAADALEDGEAEDADALLELELLGSVEPPPPVCVVALLRSRSSPRVAFDGHANGSCGG